MSRERPVPWAPAWIFLWVGVVAVLIPAAFFLSFWHWWTAVVVGFGVPETIGTLKHDDRYPPLTHVVVRYLHPELGLPLLYLAAGSIGAYWFGFPRPGRIGLLIGFIGWLTAHFLLRWIPNVRRPLRR